MDAGTDAATWSLYLRPATDEAGAWGWGQLQEYRPGVALLVCSPSERLAASEASAHQATLRLPHTTGSEHSL